MTPMTAAQSAQQNNRTADGKYATKVAGESGVAIDTPVPAEVVDLIERSGVDPNLSDHTGTRLDDALAHLVQIRDHGFSLDHPTSLAWNRAGITSSDAGAATNDEWIGYLAADGDTLGELTRITTDKPLPDGYTGDIYLVCEAERGDWDDEPCDEYDGCDGCKHGALEPDSVTNFRELGMSNTHTYVYCVHDPAPVIAATSNLAAYEAAADASSLLRRIDTGRAPIWSALSENPDTRARLDALVPPSRDPANADVAEVADRVWDRDALQKTKSTYQDALNGTGPGTATAGLREAETLVPRALRDARRPTVAAIAAANMRAEQAAERAGSAAALVDELDKLSPAAIEAVGGRDQVQRRADEAAAELTEATAERNQTHAQGRAFVELLTRVEEHHEAVDAYNAESKRLRRALHWPGTPEDMPDED